MTFAQIAYGESLADIEVCLPSCHDQVYRLGFRSPVAHTTRADANSYRDYPTTIFVYGALKRTFKVLEMVGNCRDLLGIVHLISALDEVNVFANTAIT